MSPPCAGGARSVQTCVNGAGEAAHRRVLTGNWKTETISALSDETVQRAEYPSSRRMCTAEDQGWLFDMLTSGQILRSGLTQ